MKRKIVKIDTQKCDGCGLCVNACEEGALQLVNGKASLVSEVYCDGLGACLPKCPAGAITIEEREAAEFDEKAVQKYLETKQKSLPEKLACGCTGTLARTIERETIPADIPVNLATTRTASGKSQLRQWPCQIRLVPADAPYLDNANLLVAADCTAYAYANIHQDFIRNKITLIGCPKLDDFNYIEKLTAILQGHEIKNITVLRMEVACCKGLAKAVQQALINSGKMIPWEVVIIGTQGKIIEE